MKKLIPVVYNYDYLHKANFDESEHPREHGRFAPKGGGGGSTEPAATVPDSVKAEHKEKQPSKYESGNGYEETRKTDAVSGPETRKAYVWFHPDSGKWATSVERTIRSLRGVEENTRSTFFFDDKNNAVKAADMHMSWKKEGLPNSKEVGAQLVQRKNELSPHEPY